jgi:Tfp pilus assembly protein PilF
MMAGWFKSLIVLTLLVVTALVQGCSSAPRGSPYAPHSETARDPAKAQRLTLEAADIMRSDPPRAERLLREALTADIWHGPAHNNLGVLALHKDPPQLYEAASEFEWARKLMPGHPDPRMNLALTLERAGRMDEALATYETALEVYPNHMQTMQALARLQIRARKTNQQTTDMLREIALAGDNEHWRSWARERLASMSVDDQNVMHP